MLRITVQENGQLTRFRLEGKLKGDWVRELERCSKPGMSIPKCSFSLNSATSTTWTMMEDNC